MNRVNIALQESSAGLLLSGRGLLQRKCGCGKQKNTGGDCNECKKKKNLIQRKLSVGASNDPLEVEADLVAGQIISMKSNAGIARTFPRIQRASMQSGGGEIRAPASVNQVLASSGKPMEPELKQDMEKRFNFDFSKVRVHIGSAAEQSTVDVNAHAYTVGQNIVFGAGQYMPKTQKGRRLLAHELTHVVQQARSPKKVQRQVAHTYTYLTRGSYGQTTPGFTRPSCTMVGTNSTLVAGSAAPNITVFATGTYQVRRDDGVVKTANCTRLAAGLALTRAHENSHAAGARAAVTAANTAQGLPRTFTPPATCPGAFLTAWNTSVDAAWENERVHGPGTNPPTAQTFTQEHAAGTCTFT